MVVLLWHAHEQVVAALCYLWCNLELGICQWVQLDVLIVWIDGGHHTFLNDEVEDEQETAAHLDDLWWLTTREDNQLVLVDESALDVEVLDLEVELAVGEPGPLFLRWLQTNISLIDCGFKLELVIFKIDNGEKSQCLLLIVLDEDLLGDRVLRWQRAGLGPCILLDVVRMAHPVLVATAEKQIRNLIFLSLRYDTGPD